MPKVNVELDTEVEAEMAAEMQEYVPAQDLRLGILQE